jgi:hypothetical protein
LTEDRASIITTTVTTIEEIVKRLELVEERLTAAERKRDEYRDVLSLAYLTSSTWSGLDSAASAEFGGALSARYQTFTTSGSAYGVTR